VTTTHRVAIERCSRSATSTQSSPGISHTRFEDTPKPALDKSIRVFLMVVERTIARLSASKPAKKKRAA
jgi:hypothetical protein